jgi:membrane protease YdiL (CAAX protease family)
MKHSHSAVDPKVPPPQQTATDRHGVAVSLALHLLPGLAILAAYLLWTPFLAGLGLHAEGSQYLAFLLVGIPLSLWIMARHGFAKTGRWSIRAAVALDSPMSGRRWVLAICFLVAFAGYIAAIDPLTRGMSSGIAAQMEGALPGWFLNPYSHRFAHPGETAILGTLVLRLLVDGLLHPVVEEIYFRGYLMPRLGWMGAWSPAVCAVFFALFHTWQPQNIPGIALTVLPWMYFVWWTRSLKLSILIHCMGNSLGAAVAIGEYLG